MLAVLRQRNFALSWLGQLISVFGDWVMAIALPFYIFDLTGSALATGAMFMASNVPKVLLGSVAGVFVDRWDRRRTMIAADLLRAALILVILTVHSVHWLWLIYLVVFTQATIGQFFNPAKNAIIPLLVGTSDLVAANSLYSLSGEVTRLIAPALGGVLFGLFGMASIVWIDSASFLISGVLIVCIVLPTGAPRTDTTARGISWKRVLGDWRDGMRLVRADPMITAIFAAVGTAMIGEGFFSTLIVPFVKEVLHGRPQDFGWLVSAQAIGGLVGSLMIGRIGTRVRPGILIPLSGILFGLFDLALAALPGRGGLPLLATALAAITLAGAPVIGFSVGGQIVLQASVTNNYRGRVFGAYATTVALMTLVGQGTSSVLADHLGIVPVFMLAGTFEFLGGVVAFVLLRRASPIAPSPGPAPEIAAIAGED